MLSSTEKYEEAVTHYQAAIKLEPDFVKAHNNLKMVLLQLKENEQK